MSNTNDLYDLIQNVFVYTMITQYIIIILIQIPWIIYLIINISQKKKIVSGLMRNGYQDEDKNLTLKHTNKLLLYKYLLINVNLELLAWVIIVINVIISLKPIYLYNIEWIRFAYFYVKYVSWLIEMVLAICILETLNLTTLFVKDVYLRNSTHSGMRKKINRFITRFLLLLALGVSGIGLGIAYILCEVFLITQLVQYYRYSRQLYRSLGMHYEDTKYEFGSKSIEARTALKHKKHYKWWTIWMFIIAFCLVVFITLFVITIPFQLLNERFIEQRLTENNITFIYSDIYYYINIAGEFVSNGFGLILSLIYMPTYVMFSLYYLCDKFLFVRVYRHRFHVNDNYEIESLGQPLIQ